MSPLFHPFSLATLAFGNISLAVRNCLMVSHNVRMLENTNNEGMKLKLSELGGFHGLSSVW